MFPLSSIRFWECNTFLFAYLFFSTGGTIWTIFLAVVFIDLYNVSLQGVVLISGAYLLCMIVGTMFGLWYNRVSNIRESISLTIQTVLFICVFASFYICVILDLGFSVSLGISLFNGFLYAWNMSVARGYMSGIAPMEKRCELMGIYSTFTYAGIAIVSILYTGFSLIGLGIENLALILIAFMLPSFFFLVRLMKWKGVSKGKYIQLES